MTKEDRARDGACVQYLTDQATNEGGWYDRFLALALEDRHNTSGTYTLEDTVGALGWASVAGSFMRTHNGAAEDCLGGERYTIRQRLLFAVALCDYYREHLEEWTPEERKACASRLGMPGAVV